MFALTGNKIFDVLIVLVTVYIISEVCIWLFKKFFVNDVSKPVGGVYEVSKDNSDNK